MKRKRQLNRALRVIHQTINELSYFESVESVSLHADTIDRIIWLRARLGESLIAIREDRRSDPFPESLIEVKPWP
jgi:hypothetical protein